MIGYHVPVVVEILKAYDNLGTPEDHLVFLFSPQISSWMSTDTSGYPISVSPVTFPKRSPTRALAPMGTWPPRCCRRGQRMTAVPTGSPWVACFSSFCGGMSTHLSLKEDCFEVVPGISLIWGLRVILKCG